MGEKHEGPRRTVWIESTQIRWFSDGPHEQWPKALKTKLSSKGATRLESTQIRWFLWWPRERLDRINVSQRCSRGSWKMSLGSQGTYLKTGIGTAKKRVKLLFLRGCWRRQMSSMMMMMRWEPVHHRTFWQQYCAPRNSSPGINSSLLNSAERCGGGRK